MSQQLQSLHTQHRAQIMQVKRRLAIPLFAKVQAVGFGDFLLRLTQSVPDALTQLLHDFLQDLGVLSHS